MISAIKISPIEKIFFTRDGYEIDFNRASWKLSKDVSVAVSKATKFLNDEKYYSYREILAFYAKSNAPTYVEKMHRQCMHYFSYCNGEHIFDYESLISYRNLLDKKGEPHMAVLRIFIRKWKALGYGGISDKALQLLNKWTLSGGEKGGPIRSMCPESGPLTDIEMDAIISAIITEFEKGGLQLFDVSIAMAVIMTGRRPGQITALKIGDLIEDLPHYYINVPRAKQRSEGGWRKTFKKIPIVEDLWILLQQQACDVYKEFSNRIDISVEYRSKLPLFPNYSSIDKSSDISNQLSSDRLHLRVDTLNRVMVHVSEKINVTSERTGLPIHMNAYRFRYTLGTNLGREGKGEYVIAEVLDHCDTQHTGVYVKNLPEIVERIDKAVAYQLAPIAQAFQGILIKSEHEALRSGDPSSRIANGTDNLGNCGSYGFCGALAPVACYTCSHFQPWLDGPHEAVLDRLLEERNRVLDITDDRKIASVNDRLILAVSDVVVRCKKMKAEA